MGKASPSSNSKSWHSQKPEVKSLLHKSVFRAGGGSPRRCPTTRAARIRASKAASDHLVRAYHHTYGLPVTVSNAIDASKIGRELGWRPAVTDLAEGLAATVRWYLDHPTWVEHVRSGEYRAWMAKNYARRDEEVAK